MALLPDSQDAFGGPRQERSFFGTSFPIPNTVPDADLTSVPNAMYDGSLSFYRRTGSVETEIARLDNNGWLQAGDYFIGKALTPTYVSNKDTANTAVVAFVGDSTFSQSGGIDQYMNGVDADAITTWNGLAVTTINVGEGGRTIRTMHRIAGLYLNPVAYHRLAGLNVAVVWGGTNDIYWDNVTAAQTYSYIKAFCEHLTLLGWKVILVSPISRAGTSTGGLVMDAQLSTLSDLLKANWREFAVRYVDFKVISPTVFGAGSGGYANATYYSDGTHQTVAGQKLLAASISPVVNDYLAHPEIRFAKKLGIRTSNSTDTNDTFVVSNDGAQGLEVEPGTDMAGAAGATVRIQSFNRSTNAYSAFDYSASSYRWGIGSGSSGVERMRLGLGLNIGGTTDPGAGRFAITTAVTPASAAAAGVAGTVAWDASFIYVCVATNTWKRVAIATW